MPGFFLLAHLNFNVQDFGTVFIWIELFKVYDYQLNFDVKTVSLQWDHVSTKLFMIVLLLLLQVWCKRDSDSGR